MKIQLVALALLLALPLAAPAPATCADPCSVAASSLGYAPPAFVIASGTTVTFDNAGGGAHVTADGSGSGLSAPFCFSAGDGVPVRFAITSGVLEATMGDDTLACANAQALAGGSFAVPFFCRLHTNMRGALVVSPP